MLREGGGGGGGGEKGKANWPFLTSLLHSARKAVFN